jgi:hypothetical protein
MDPKLMSLKTNELENLNLMTDDQQQCSQKEKLLQKEIT